MYVHEIVVNTDGVCACQVVVLIVYINCGLCFFTCETINNYLALVSVQYCTCVIHLWFDSKRLSFIFGSAFL